MTDQAFQHALAEVQPKSLAARLRPYMPAIDERHRAGVSYADLAAKLAEQGFAIAPRTLQIYLLRYRAGLKAAPRAMPKPTGDATHVRTSPARPFEHSPHVTPEEVERLVGPAKKP